MFPGLLSNKIQPPPYRPGEAIRTVAGADDEARAAAVVLMGFAADPVARWAYPEADEYLTHFPRFIRAFAGSSFAHGRAFYAEDFTGAALWLPPGVGPDEDGLVSLFQSTVAENRRKDLFAVVEQMGDYHPAEPHWYLPMIAVDPCRQNRGYGAALLRHALFECDRERLPAYLESSNPRNIPLYRRFGFEVVGTIQSGSSPPMFPMLRKPR